MFFNQYVCIYVRFLITQLRVSSVLRKHAKCHTNTSTYTSFTVHSPQHRLQCTQTPYIVRHLSKICTPCRQFLPFLLTKDINGRPATAREGSSPSLTTVHIYGRPATAREGSSPSPTTVHIYGRPATAREGSSPSLTTVHIYGRPATAREGSSPSLTTVHIYQFSRLHISGGPYSILRDLYKIVADGCGNFGVQKVKFSHTHLSATPRIRKAECGFGCTYVCETSRNGECTVEANGRNLLFKSRYMKL